MRRLTPALLLSLLPTLALPAAGPPRPKLAVTEITAPSGDASLTSLLSEMALTQASSSAHFAVIGQSDVAALLGLARTKQMLGCGDQSECIAEIGGALGVDYLLVGKAGALGALWRLDVKLVDVKRQSVVARFGESVEPRPELLAAAIQRCVRDVLAAATPSALTARRKAGWITAGAGAACLAGSAVFALLTKSAWDEMKAAEDAGDAAEWDRKRDLVKRRALAADVLLGAGVAGAGVGVWLIFGGSEGTKARLTALPGGAAIALEGSF